MSGFIAMSRKAFDHPLLKDAERFRAWFWMVAKACWKPTPYDVRGKMITLERGQFCTSRDQLSKDFGWSPSAVERFLTRLETEQMIRRETGQGKTIITICNYSQFQDFSDETGQPTGQPTGQKSDRNRTAKEQGNKGTIEEEPNGSSPPISPKRSKPRVADGPALPDWLPVEPWQAFLDMRKRKKALPTGRAVALLIQKLDRMRSTGQDPGAVLDQSTVNNWTDLYDLKDDANGNRSQAGRKTYPGNDTRDGFQRYLDRSIFGTGPDGSGPPAEPPGRRDAGAGSADRRLPPARADTVR